MCQVWRISLGQQLRGRGAGWCAPDTLSPVTVMLHQLQQCALMSPVMLDFTASIRSFLIIAVRDTDLRWDENRK